MWELWGRWDLVLLHVVFFSLFILSGLIPFKKRKRRPAGIFMAFIIALFTEMYGFPLTIYILTSLFGGLPGTYFEGHLLGLQGAAFGGVLESAGFILIFISWPKIYRAKNKLITWGVYRYVRHPQYLGILILTLGMIIHWTALIALLMWPVLAFLYYRLARREEKEMEKRFGKKYIEYKRRVPMFIPFLVIRGKKW